MPNSAILVLDVGKTNKKWMLFDRALGIVDEGSVRLPETTDEDGFACEDVQLLAGWVRDTVESVATNPRYQLQAVNFSGYGASLVYLDRHGQVLAPMYNYLKPYPDYLRRTWSERYGPAEALALETASPGMDSLNSGLQLYRFKREQPTRFGQLAYALHLPQYLSYCLTKQPVSDHTSVGCHTALWDYRAGGYHRWVLAEGLDRRLAPLVPTETRVPVRVGSRILMVGVGIHDSSAALLPHLAGEGVPFVLLSTGTWNVSLNPFDHSPLTKEILNKGGLCYLLPDGRPVKASRFLAGPLVEQGVAMEEIMALQRQSTGLVLEAGNVSRIVLAGGFSGNESFRESLRRSFPDCEVRLAVLAQASALGAAMVVHDAGNRSIPGFRI